MLLGGFVSGKGPTAGWVTVRTKGKDLMLPVLENKKVAPTVSPAGFAAASAEPRVNAPGVPKRIVSPSIVKKTPIPPSPPPSPLIAQAAPKLRMPPPLPVPRRVVPPIGDVVVPLCYLRRDDEADCTPTYIDVSQWEHGGNHLHARFVQHPMAITDGRPEAESLALDRHGVMFVPHTTALLTSDFYERPERIWAEYYAEMRALVQQATGASRVFVIGERVRNNDKKASYRSVEGYVGYAHNDYTEESATQRLRELATSPSEGGSGVSQRVRSLSGPLVNEEEVELMLQRRFMVITVWRNISQDPIGKNPLALCDGSTISVKDLVPFALNYKDTVGRTYGLTHNRQHRWLYFSGMRNDEAVLFKQYDSKSIPGVVRYTGHTSFTDPRSAEDMPTRESIETRCLASFDDADEEKTGVLAANLFPDHDWGGAGARHPS